MKAFFLLFVPALVSGLTCEDDELADLPFCDTTLDPLARAQDLVSRMTLEEKNAQMGTFNPAIERLGVIDFTYWSESLHGVASSPGVSFSGELKSATSFPQVIGLGATFDTDLVHEMAKVISTEDRAFNNANQAGLTFFTPNINIFRDPRWGRGQETPGEDPFWTSEYVVALITGLQNGEEDPDHLKIGATCKHFVAYDLEVFEGVDRHHFDAIVPDKDMFETYAPPFQACIQRGGVDSVMCSYNSVNGVPSCANDALNNGLIRDEWGFEGYIVSDCAAVEDIFDTHHFAPDLPGAAGAAITGGCDLSCGTELQNNNAEALDQKAFGLTEDDIDQALSRVFRTRMRLGHFDPVDEQPFLLIGDDQVDTQDHRDLALRAAQEAMVLLQNNNDVLPLSPDDLTNVAVIGPHAEATTDMQGNYNGIAPFLVSPLEGIQTLLGTGVTVTTAQGTGISDDSTDGFDEAISLVNDADATIVVLGINQSIEREGFDRTSLELTGVQWSLLEAIRDASNGKPVILVMLNGGPIDLTRGIAASDAIIWAGYPGQSGGTAIAQTIFGENNPSGRLPYTVYPAEYVDEIDMFDMVMREGPGRTYKFYTGDAVFPFGFGLSYTEFDVAVTQTTNLPSTLTVQDMMAKVLRSMTLTVTNIGDVAGDHILLGFRSGGGEDAPIRKLVSIERVSLDSGESTTVEVQLSMEMFTEINDDGESEMVPGVYTLQINDGEVIRTITLLDTEEDDAADAEVDTVIEEAVIPVIVVVGASLFICLFAVWMSRSKNSQNRIMERERGRSPEEEEYIQLSEGVAAAQVDVL